MVVGKFIWADLSTYDTGKSIAYYTSIFDAEVTNFEGYHLLSKNGIAFAGIYETPAFFKKIKMPHFWMSYFQVKSVAEVSKIAESNGGKVEISNIPFYNGNISLIRDPLGAGFTIYDGKDLQLPRDKENRSMLHTELHASDLKKVMPFYKNVFNWDYKEIEKGIYQIWINDEKSSIQLREIPNQLKGKYEYWAITFKVEEVNKTIQLSKENEGQIISNETLKILISDISNEAFFYIENL